MIENATSAASIQSMLRTLARFGQAIERALEQVNDAQGKAKSLREAYESGEQIPLTDVVIQMQKASLSFEATLQVRNKVMKAYEDILNMPV